MFWSTTRRPPAVLARRASAFARSPVVWQVIGRTLAVAAAAPAQVFAAPGPQAELYRPVLANAGLDVVVERGQLIGEVRGLEVARVVLNRRRCGAGRRGRRAI